VPVSQKAVAAPAQPARTVLNPTLRRLTILKAAVVIACGFGLVLSAPLWIGPRSYPTASLWPGLPPLGHPIDQILYLTMLVTAVAILLASRPQLFIAAFLAILAVFCALDQTRWQPWLFQYVAMLGALGLFSWRERDHDGQRRTLNIVRLIIVGTYFFAGVQKINWNFVDVDFPALVTPLTDAVPGLKGPLYYCGMAAPLAEAGFALGLLTRRFRRVSLMAAVGMHLLILAMLGPFGQNWNFVVWPWTAAMAVFDLLLFTGPNDFTWREILPARPLSSQSVALLMFGILPFLSFANLWDSYLSAAIYAGNLTEATFYTSDIGYAVLPNAVRDHFQRAGPDTHVANVQRWTIEELHVTPYPETRVFKAVGRQLCQFESDPRQLVLIVHEQRLLFSAPETGYRCDQLL
jgi:hypothetical protein